MKPGVVIAKAGLVGLSGPLGGLHDQISVRNVGWHCGRGVRRLVVAGSFGNAPDRHEQRPRRGDLPQHAGAERARWRPNIKSRLHGVSEFIATRVDIHPIIGGCRCTPPTPSAHSSSGPAANDSYSPSSAPTI